MLYLIPIFAMLHLIYDLWHRHSVFTPALSIYTGTWCLIPVPRHLIFRHQYSIYVILDTWSWHPVYDACFHVVQVHWPDIVALDRTLPPLIPVLYNIFMTITFMGTWHDYYIITRYLVLLNSCILEPPEIGRLLTLLLILYSYWPP